MRTKQKAFFKGTVLFLFLFIFSVGSGRTQENIPDSLSVDKPILLDSLLHQFSIEELAKFKDYYENEILLLEKEKKLLRNKGIDDGEKIYATNPARVGVDKILFRLAEFHYLKEQDDLFKKMDEYEKEFSRFEAGERSEPPPEPKPDYSKVIQYYKIILEKFPDSQLKDDVLYHLAFTYDKNFAPDSAVYYYEMVANNYPKTDKAADALIRIGEYYFAPQRRDLDKAIQYYSQVLQYRDTPRYDEALYKLGWCYYLQEGYNQAIETFALLVDDIEKSTPLDPQGEYTNPSLEDEALEYMGISFYDAGGLPSALHFIDALDRPEYGVNILEKLGDIYRENEEEYVQSMHVYNALLERYPFHIKAPEIQEKIVQCARELEDPDEIYLAQQTLFATYKPGSDWQKQMSQKIQSAHKRQQVLKNASQKAEFALRDNINLMIQLGEEKKDLSYYSLVVDDAQNYLQTFPTDTNAYTIHWNTAVILDTKLDQKEKAYQAYLDICNNYMQDKFRKYAAQNAIVLAREMAPAISNADSIITPDSLVSVAEMNIDQLDSTSSAEQSQQPSLSNKRLIDAYDNFIMHFPNDEETAVVLSNVGMMYYNDKQFNNALKYFNTLLARFPDSPQTQQAQFTAMESYFGKRDFASTEILAKKIQGREDLPQDLKEKAKKRMAESIYLHAESLAGENKNLEAANEFKRVVEEVPDAIFADKALFQSGLQYDLAKNYEQAIDVYSKLINQFPNSEHYLDSINNLALDYAELKEYQLAAQVYEKLANSQPDSALARDALYNSSYFFVQDKDWTNAIRVNRTYVERYPNAADAEDMFYDIAEYYLKLDDLEHANEIYGDFATKYPNSPRTVETYFKRGEYFKDKSRIQDAFREFDLAIAKNKELKNKNLPANDFYAAEALFNKSEEQYKQYATIQFTQNNMQSAQNRKKELLQQLEQQYGEVAKYGTIRIYESMFKIGKLYEDFAVAWANQEIPAMDETEQVVFTNKLNQTSAQLYDRAFESYKSNYKTLTKLAANYQPQPVENDSSSSTRVVEEDSTLQVANKWIDATANKSSEMLYRIAELNSSSIDRILQAPIPQGLDEVSTLEYRNQVLAKAVFPLVQEITKAHIRNLNEADSLRLENEWVEKSEQKLLEVMSILPERYKQLCLDAFKTYSEKYNRYVDIMTTGTMEEKENSLDLAGKLVNLIELEKNYADLMLANYKVSIDRLIQLPSSEGLAPVLFSDCVNTTVQLADRFKNSGQKSRQMKDKFTILNQQNPQMIYEDAIYTFTDNETYLHDNALAVCETTYDMKKQYDFNNLQFAKLAALMVELAPETYAQEFDIPVETWTFIPDSTWKMAFDVTDSSWMLPDFNSNEWSSAYIRVDTTDGAIPVIVSYMEPDLSLPDSLDNNDSLLVNLNDSSDFLSEKPHPMYLLRKDIVLNDIPLSAMLRINADDNVWVYLNGIQVFQESDSTLGWGNTFETDLTPFLKPGKNVLAIKVQDIDESGNGVQPDLELQAIHREKLVEEEQKLAQKELNINGVIDMDALIFNRYYVPEM